MNCYFRMILLVLFSGVFQTHAAVITICNLPAGIANYSSIQLAINAASSGDTLYLYGSAKSYGTAQLIDKQLTLIGPGIYPERQNQLSARLDFVDIQNTNASGAPSGTSFHGLVFQSAIQVQGALNTNYLSFNACWFKDTITMQSGNNRVYRGYVFSNNYFSGAGISFQSNSGNTTSVDSFEFVNNVVFASRPTFFKEMYTSSSTRIRHTIFYSNLPGASIFDNATCKSFVLENNVFIQMAQFQHGEQMTYGHNLTFNCDNNTPWLLPNQTDAGGNLGQTDPLLQDQSIMLSGVQNPGLHFNIQAGSPCFQAGTNNESIGLLFKPYPEHNFRRSLQGVLSFVERVIPGASAYPGSNMPIQFKAQHIKK